MRCELYIHSPFKYHSKNTHIPFTSLSKTLARKLLFFRKRFRLKYHSNTIEISLEFHSFSLASTSRFLARFFGPSYTTQIPLKYHSNSTHITQNVSANSCKVLARTPHVVSGVTTGQLRHLYVVFFNCLEHEHDRKEGQEEKVASIPSVDKGAPVFSLATTTTAAAATSSPLLPSRPSAATVICLDATSSTTIIRTPTAAVISISIVAQPHQPPPARFAVRLLKMEAK